MTDQVAAVADADASSCAEARDPEQLIVEAMRRLRGLLDRPSMPAPALDQGTIVPLSEEVVADRDTRARRDARNPGEETERTPPTMDPLRDPTRSVPPFGEWDVVAARVRGVVADRDAVGGRHARFAVEVIAAAR